MSTLDGRNLPFTGTGTAAPCPDDPIYIGGVYAGQRGTFGPVDLEVYLDQGRIEFGPYTFPHQQAFRLWQMLGRSLDLLGPDPRLVPVPESGRGIAGWNMEPARNSALLAANGTPWEGETLP